jgi:hypothetical protein
LEKNLIPKKISTPTSANLKDEHPHLVHRPIVKPAVEDDIKSRQSFSQLSQAAYDHYVAQKGQYLECGGRLTRKSIKEFNSLVKEVFKQIPKEARFTPS